MIAATFVISFLIAVALLSLPRFLAHRFAGSNFFSLCWSDNPGSLAWHFQDFRELATCAKDLSRY